MNFERPNVKISNVLFYVFVILLTLLLISSFIVPKATLMNAYVIGPRLWFNSLTAIFLFLVAVSSLFFNSIGKIVKLNLIDLLISSMLLFILLRQFFEYNHDFFSDKIVNYICLTLLYFIIKFYLDAITIKKLKNVINTATLVILLIGLVSSSLGLLQLYGIIAPNDSYFKVTGQFRSPAPYANFIISILPFAITSALLFPKECNWHHFIKYLAVATLVIGLLVLPVTYTRAAWIGILAAAAFIFLRLFINSRLIKFRKRTTVLVSSCVVIGLISLFGLYHIKPKSADGRVLIWKISTDIIKQHPLTGIGYGNFEGQYNLYQAMYFSKNVQRAEEVQIADKVFYAYNISIQILAEQGIIGLVLFMTLLLCISRLVISSFRNNNQDYYISFIIISVSSCLLSIIFCGQFSYPFDILPVYIIFFIAIAFLSTTNRYYKNLFELKIRFNYLKALGILLIPCSILIAINAEKKYRAYTYWKTMYRNGGTVDSLRKLYPILNKDGNFMAMYGKLLLDKKKYSEAILVLEETNNQISDPFVCINLAQAYSAMGKYKKSELYFITASNMIPNRLYSKYLLAKLYFETGQTNKAKKLSMDILTRDPKVQSSAAREIKNDILKLIQLHTN